MAKLYFICPLICEVRRTEPMALFTDFVFVLKLLHLTKLPSAQTFWLTHSLSVSSVTLLTHFNPPPFFKRLKGMFRIDI